MLHPALRRMESNEQNLDQVTENGKS